MKYEVTLGGRRLRVDVDQTGRSVVDDKVVAADLRETIRGRQWSVALEGRSHEVTVLSFEPYRLAVDGLEVLADVADERALAARRGARRPGGGRHEVRAPMPGLIKALHAAEGDAVARGAPLVTLEAMKMENELLAPASGQVSRVLASAGSKVEGGALLLVLSEDA